MSIETFRFASVTVVPPTVPPTELMLLWSPLVGDRGLSLDVMILKLRTKKNCYSFDDEWKFFN